MASTVYRRDPNRSGSGFAVDYTRTAAKQSWEKKNKELTVFRSSNYGSVTAARLRNDMLLAFGGLSVTLLSMTTGGITLYFGGVGKAAAVYLVTFVLGFTGVAVNCEKEYP